MNDHNERISQLEAAQAALEARDARRESEHVSLLKTYTEANAARETMRRQFEEDYMLLGKAFDARIGELAARAPDGMIAAETVDAFRWMAELMKENNRHVSEVFTMFDDRVRAIEQLLLPALQGRAKIMAVAP